MNQPNNNHRILYFHSDEITILGIPFALHLLGYDVVETDFKPHLSSYMASEIPIIEKILRDNNVEIVITYNYIPVVSAACEVQRIKYLAWVFDCPQLELYRSEAANEYTYVSIFDKKEYTFLKKNTSIKHLMYYPLAADIDALTATVIDKNDEEYYKEDISFLGRIYNRNYTQTIYNQLDSIYQTQVRFISNRFSCKYDPDNSLFGYASDELIEQIYSKFNSFTKDLIIDKRHFVESLFLAPLCTNVDRTRTLNTLAKNHSIILYSDEINLDQLNPNIQIRGRQDYWSDMPKVFSLSKINLNITSKSIRSGIAQRIWDILAVGGFCLTNYQSEITDYFIPGKELAVYHNLSELRELTDYYLMHDDERIQIGLNGYKKVREIGDMKMRIKDVLDHVIYN